MSDHQDTPITNNNDEALASRIMQYVNSTSSNLPTFPGDDIESLPSDYEYDPNNQDEEEEEIEEVEEISEMDLLNHLDQAMPPLLLAQNLFNTISDPSILKILSAENVNELFHQGYTILDNVLDLSVIQSVREWATRLFKDGKMDKASQKHNQEDDPFRHGLARGDYTIWVSPGSEVLNENTALNHVVDWFSKELHQDLEKVVDLRGEAEYQLAFYPADQQSMYERHRDAFPTDDRKDLDQRRVTAIVYFNPEWQQGDGGELRIFKKSLMDDTETHQDIAPKAARCVVFLSGVMDHAVLPSNEERIALTSWYR